MTDLENELIFALRSMVNDARSNATFFLDHEICAIHPNTIKTAEDTLARAVDITQGISDPDANLIQRLKGAVYAVGKMVTDADNRDWWDDFGTLWHEVSKDPKAQEYVDNESQRSFNERNSED